MSGEVELGTKTASLNCTNPRAFQMPLFLLGHKTLKQLWNRCTNNYFTLSPAVPPPSDLFVSAAAHSVSAPRISLQSLSGWINAGAKTHWRDPCCFLKVPGKSLTGELLRFPFPSHFSPRPRQNLNWQCPTLLVQLIPVDGLWLCSPSSSLWAPQSQKQLEFPRLVPCLREQFSVRKQSLYQSEDFGVGFGW